MSTSLSQTGAPASHGKNNKQGAATHARQWRLVPGLLLAGAFALVSMLLSRFPWFQSHGLSTLTVAIVLGMLLGNTLYPRFAAPTLPGVAFSKQRLLRLGIVLFGLRLTFQDVAGVGLAGVAIDAVMLCSTFLLACLAGRKLFGLDRATTMLIGAGGSICGAAAVMAAEPVVKAKPEQVAVSVATVVVFGTLAMFLYPLLYQWNLQHGWIQLSPDAYGVYVGSTVHEVAQVVVAGGAVSPEAANTAVIAKMVRVMMLAPFLLALSYVLMRGARASGSGARGGMVIPWFAVWFLVVVGINSTGIVPAAATGLLLVLDELLLAMAMFALGLTTHMSAIRQAGLKPLALASLLAVWLLAGGLLVNLGVAWLAGSA
ncbi:YeiH family protein [Paracandidimonas soli]|uniref:Putative integral membrane protein (TIGR00698 family) n=1 Tax=Paracandidimonas soli TaxID=1917182 RepID=A0A4R3URZ0_9BURK|nr:YeiH family protein [Paracandidimonas soli]TCU93168.1 putative integral membrane protein (TIGR00698 family) [Paracandidimonas soli]